MIKEQLRLIFLFLTIFLVSILNVNATAYISQTIYSPFGTILDHAEASYFDGETSDGTFTVTTSRFRDFAENYETNTFGVSTNPFCRIGGRYSSYVSNGPRVTEDAQKTHYVRDGNLKVYDCLTTEQLIDLIKIPSSWKNDNLVLYCNDGSIINFNDINFDLFTNQINTYKGCVLKNLDLEVDNTAFFGFEVGDVQVDDDEGYRFDAQKVVENSKGVLNITNTYTENRTGSRTAVVTIEYTNNCHWKLNYDVNTGDRSYEQECSYGPAYGPNDSCPDELITLENGTQYLQSVPAGSCDSVTSQISSTFSSYTGFVKTIDVNIRQHSVYEVTFEEDYSYNEYSVTHDDTGSTFHYDYDPYYTFYSLRNFPDALDTSLKEVFHVPSKFDLSRVANFRSFEDNRKAYGFETPLILINREFDTSKPIYSIELKEFPFFQRDCYETLGAFGAENKDTISRYDMVSCTGDNRILINSITTDSNFGLGFGFNLFKNIVLDLE